MRADSQTPNMRPILHALINGAQCNEFDRERQQPSVVLVLILFVRSPAVPRLRIIALVPLSQCVVAVAVVQVTGYWFPSKHRPEFIRLCVEEKATWPFSRPDPPISCAPVLRAKLSQSVPPPPPPLSFSVLLNFCSLSVLLFAFSLILAALGRRDIGESVDRGTRLVLAYSH